LDFAKSQIGAPYEARSTSGYDIDPAADEAYKKGIDDGRNRALAEAQKKYDDLTAPQRELAELPTTEQLKATLQLASDRNTASQANLQRISEQSDSAITSASQRRAAAARSRDEDNALFNVEHHTTGVRGDVSVYRANERADAERQRDAERKRKEEEALAKHNQPFIDSSRDIQSQTRSVLSGGITGNAERQAGAVLDRLGSGMPDTGLLQTLVGLIGQIHAKSSSLDQARQNQLKNIESQIRTLQSQIASDRHTAG